ncbi:hypothetical protein BGZ65_009816 [Modicella reniformis]|uniref:Uncharacterized protein n=1 Tax=Modicella reniformis TaxID=1440133 RepID=A0A9P6JG52_9FUNG|nr:hypothetical protein BGZ65_009816 [Modicella reniformis]
MIQLTGGENVTLLASTLGVGPAGSGKNGNSNTNNNNNQNNNNNNATTATINTTGGNTITIPNPNNSNNNNNNNINQHDNSNSGLRRLPTLGNIKRLTNETQQQRAKIQELERYLWGLKEALILAREQVHAKDLEAKQAEERKRVEIHELGQYIQRCDATLSAKTIECDSLKNQLHHQSKEQVSKLKHIRMLESEIRDFRRMSSMSTGTHTGPCGTGGAVTNNRDSTDLTESIRSSTYFGSGAITSFSKKDEQLEELKTLIEKLKGDHMVMTRPEGERRSSTASVMTPSLPPPRPPRPPSSLFANNPNACFPYIPPPPHATVLMAPLPAPPTYAPSHVPVLSPLAASPPVSAPPSPVKTVGYNFARYQSQTKQDADATAAAVAATVAAAVAAVTAAAAADARLKVEIGQLDGTKKKGLINNNTIEPVDKNTIANNNNNNNNKPKTKNNKNRIKLMSGLLTTSSPSLHHPAAWTLTPLDMNALAIDRPSSSSSMGSTISVASVSTTPTMSGSPTSVSSGPMKSLAPTTCESQCDPVAN